MELTRYVVLNPVGAGMVSSPADWPWSSYRASAGLRPQVNGVLAVAYGNHFFVQLFARVNAHNVLAAAWARVLWHGIFLTDASWHKPYALVGMSSTNTWIAVSLRSSQ